MKTRILFLFVTLIITNSYSQNLLEKNNTLVDNLTNLPINLVAKKSVAKTDNLLAGSLSYDCSTVFWTVNTVGEIQQWDLKSNQVTGGAVVQTNSGSSLSFCGADGILTFYSAKYPSTGIKKYDTSSSSWIGTPTGIPLMNNGGYHENQYFYYYDSKSGTTKDLYHFDGTNLTLIEHFSGSTHFLVADIAVDSSGRAWVFTGSTASSLSSIDTLRIYDSTGLVSSYPFIYNDESCYGSFLINDQLYIGIATGNSLVKNTNSILPINVIGSVVKTGTPIPFPYINYTDMASCNSKTNLNLQTNTKNNTLLIYPNPSNDIITINLDENIVSVDVYSMENKLIKTYKNKNRIDISDLEKNNYLLKIISENNIYCRLIIKK